MIVIGLKGFIGSGKSTVARYLIERHGFVRGRFAGALKAMLRALLAYRGCPADLIERMVEGDLKEKPSRYLNGRSPREAMESLGDGWGREMVHPDLWIDTEFERLLAYDYKRVLVEDTRYENEAKTIRGLGGAVWEVFQPGLVPKDLPTERAQQEIKADLVLYNEIGKLDTTYGLVDVLIEQIVAQGAE